MDANSVAAFNGEYVVATTQGLTSFDKEFDHWNKTGNEGKSVVTANGKLYTLDVKGNVYVYNNKDLENTVASYNVGEVYPTGNKAVIAVSESNGEIYVCKGENGVAKISSTGEVKQTSLHVLYLHNQRRLNWQEKLRVVQMVSLSAVNTSM